jgi:hypothetical protein
LPHWMIRAAVQGGLSLLPKSHFWNYLVQKHLTKTLYQDIATFHEKLYYSRRHIENYGLAAPESWPPVTVLELGTGWHPAVPVALYLCGASKIWTIDKVGLVNPARVREVLRHFIEYEENGKLAEMLPWVRKDRLAVVRDVLASQTPSSSDEMLQRLRIRALVCDARRVELQDSSVNLFVSNLTLEHIPKDTLRSIFREFRRLAAPNAVMSHYTDMRDHYAGFDCSITPYNFLKYPSRVWRLCNNKLLHQNRLRVCDYRRIHADAGFKIVSERNNKGSEEDLDSIPISREFRGMSREELIVVDSWMVSTCDT